MRVSKNFTRQHVEFDLLAKKLHIKNVAPRDALRQAELLAKHILEPIFDLKPQIISWYRSPELERHYCRHDFMKWCQENNLSVIEDSWQLYLDKKGHTKGNTISLRYCPIIAEALKKLDFELLVIADYIHVRYIEEFPTGLIVDKRGNT